MEHSTTGRWWDKISHGCTSSSERCGSSYCQCHHLQCIHNRILRQHVDCGHAAGNEMTQLSANETTTSIKRARKDVTFGDKEACGVEGGLDRRAGVNHPRLVDPLKGALLRVPLHGIEGVAVC